MLYLIGLNNCDKTREARKWLQQRELEFTEIDLNEEPLEQEELDEIIYKVGLDPLMNRRSRTYKDLKKEGTIDETAMADEELAEVILNHQKLIKRPVLVEGDGILVGFDQDAWITFLGLNEELNDD